MNKLLSKGIMVRSRLRNKFLKSKTREIIEAYKKQGNYCVTLLRETKRSFYENLNLLVIIRNSGGKSNLSFLIKPHQIVKSYW